MPVIAKSLIKSHDPSQDGGWIAPIFRIRGSRSKREIDRSAFAQPSQSRHCPPKHPTGDQP